MPGSRTCATKKLRNNENGKSIPTCFPPLWSKEPLASDIAKNLGNAKTDVGLVVGAPVYAELLAHPKATESFVNSFLADTGIDVDFEFHYRAPHR
jgi:hypothetical protein